MEGKLGSAITSVAATVVRHARGRDGRVECVDAFSRDQDSDSGQENVSYSHKDKDFVIDLVGDQAVDSFRVFDGSARIAKEEKTSPSAFCISLQKLANHFNTSDESLIIK